MKQLLIATVCCLSIYTGISQQSADAPYLKQKSIPAFSLKTLTNGSYGKANLRAGKPVVIFVFSPTCAHCVEETKQIVLNMKDLKQAEFVYASISSDRDQLVQFILATGIDDFSNIHLGIDKDLKLAGFFKPSVTPFVAVYDRKQQLAKVIRNGFVMPDLIRIMRSL
jgi:peroxiredoxin